MIDLHCTVPIKVVWNVKNTLIFRDAYRRALARFGMGVSPINARKFCYANAEEHSCPFCSDKIEDEKHLLLDCPVHSQFGCKYLSHLSHQCVKSTVKSQENNDIF